MQDQADDRVPLAYLLLQAGRWFDVLLRQRLADRGWPALTAAQSLAFAHLDPAGTTPSTLARKVGTTRQATHDLVAGLVQLGLVEVVDDATRRRGRLIRFTPGGLRLAADAKVILNDLESRWGGERADRLRSLLEKPPE